MRKRIISLVLTIVMLLSTVSGLAGCGKKSSDEWSITEKDFQDALYLDLSVTKGDAGAVTLTATSENEIFKSDLKDGYFYIVPIVATEVSAQGAGAESDADSSYVLTEADISAKALNKISYNRADGKTLTFGFTDTTENVIGYTAYIHKNALTSGLYGLGLGIEETGDDTVAASASIAETFTTATVNPTITIKLENALTADSFTKDMISLGNAFANLTVTNVSGAGGTVTVSTSGKVTAESSLTGTVKFSDQATTCGKDLYAVAPVEFVTAYADAATFRYTAGKLTFNVCLVEDTFVSQSGITMDGMNLTVDALSADKTAATVSVTVTGADIDAAVAELNGKDITVAASAVAGGAEYVLPFHAANVSCSMFIDFITKNEDSDSFAVEAYLFAKNGSFGTLSASDITLGGDFASATDVSVKKIADSEYMLKFNFVPAAEVNEEDFTFTGTVTVAGDKCLNTWKTASHDALSADVSYSNVSDRFGLMNIVATVRTGYNVVRAFADSHQSVIGTIKDAGSKISSGYGIAKSVLGALGIIPTTESMLKEIQSTLTEIQGSLEKMDQEILRINNAVANIGIAVEELSYQQQKSTAQTNWNMFVDTMTNMTGYIASFQTEYYKQVKSFVSKRNATITVYTDESGVTLPLNMDPDSILSINGKRILSATVVSLPDGLEKCAMLIDSNGNNIGNYYDTLTEKIKEEVQAYLPAGVTAERFITALEMTANYRAMAETGGANNIVNAYTNLCANISGTKAGKSKPLDEYYTVLENTYNFASETEALRGMAQLYLADAVIRGGTLAGLAATLVGDVDVSNAVDTAYKTALAEIMNNTGNHAVQQGQQWSYLMGHAVNTYTNRGCDSGSWAVPYYSYMDTAKCKILNNRYLRLRQAGLVSAPTLADYLQQTLGINNSEGRELILVSTPPVYSDASENDIRGWEMTCFTDYSYEGYGSGFTVGQKWSLKNHIDSGLVEKWVERYKITNINAVTDETLTTYKYVSLKYFSIYGTRLAGFDDERNCYLVYIQVADIQD